ncbi:MAG: class I SAM-dependent methyltransferase [Bacilli bacterium]|nr:class I SAM-dependent methyltransferase [Bacilli bacterium]
MESISEKNGLELIEENDLNILSIGISTSGSAEINMAKKNPNSKIIATTIDEKGLNIVKEIIDKENLNNKIEVKLEDVTKKSNYPDNYFDYIYARLVLHYLNNKDLENTLEELNRILKPNGKIFIVVRSTNAWEAKLDGTTYDEETGFTKHPDIRTYGTPDVKYCYRRLHTKESIKEFLEKAGFKVKHTKVYDEYLSPDFDRKNMNEKASELIEVLATKGE